MIPVYQSKLLDRTLLYTFLKRRKSWMTQLARFYLAAAEKVVSRASEARPIDGSGLKRFGSVISYRPLRGFPQADVKAACDGVDSLATNAGGLSR